jgi:hypothetical protein
MLKINNLIARYNDITIETFEPIVRCYHDSHSNIPVQHLEKEKDLHLLMDFDSLF